MPITSVITIYWLNQTNFFVQMARRLLLHPGVRGPQRAGEEPDPNPMRCVMAALALILFVVTFAGGGGGKAGW